jgi:large subunit ribosomal protein L24
MIAPRYHIKKNDLVMVINGKEKGKSGRVLQVLPEKEKVLIEKINFVKRHSRPHGQQRRGGIIEKEAPLHLSNVMLLCEKCNKPVRIGHRFIERDKKTRFCRKCGEIFDK